MQDQDPAVWSASALDAMRRATLTRYRLLPFLYTLFYEAKVYNRIPVRPLFMLYDYLLTAALLISVMQFKRRATLILRCFIKSLQRLLLNYLLINSAPFDATADRIDRQFMWGDALLVSPVTEAGARSVIAYFPRSTVRDPLGTAVWYDLLSGREEVGPASRAGPWVELDAPLSVIPLHLRGGSIVPTQLPGVTTILSCA